MYFQKTVMQIVRKENVDKLIYLLFVISNM